MCHDCLQEPLDESLAALPADETAEADPGGSRVDGGMFRTDSTVVGQKMPRNSMQVYFEDFRIIGYEWGLDGYGLVFKYVSIDLKMIYNCIQLQLIHSIYY